MIPQLNNCKARTNCLKQLQALTLIVLVGILAILPPSLAFLPNHNIIITNNRYNHIHRDVLAKQPLFLSDRRQAFEHNSLRTDIRIFLTQRAIQSFITLLISCRDPHTVKWLENTYGFENLENYHGTGAFNLTKYNSWNTILKDMLHRPADVVVVSARRRGRGHGGWSKDNPFLEDVSKQQKQANLRLLLTYIYSSTLFLNVIASCHDTQNSDSLNSTLILNHHPLFHASSLLEIRLPRNGWLISILWF